MFKNSQGFYSIHSLLQGKKIVQVSNKAFKKSEKLNMIKDYCFFFESQAQIGRNFPSSRFNASGQTLISHASKRCRCRQFLHHPRMEADSQFTLYPIVTEYLAKADFLVCFDATAFLCSPVRVENNKGLLLGENNI